MDETYVKLSDMMDSLDLLRSQEKRSSEVLTKLSHRLDTTDFANAFNVTSESLRFEIQFSVKLSLHYISELVVVIRGESFSLFLIDSRLLFN